MTSEFEVEVISSPERFAAIRPEWEALLGQIPDHSMFHSAEYLMSLFGAMPPGQTAYFVTLKSALTARQGQFVAVAPFVLKQGRFPLRFGVISLLSFRLQSLALPGNSVACTPGVSLAMILRVILGKLRSDGLGMIQFDCLPLDSALYRCLTEETSRSGFRFRASTPQALRGLRFSGSHEDWLGAMSKKTRYNLKRAVKQLEGQCQSAMELICVRQEDQVPDFLGNLDQVFGNTWQAAVFGYQPRNTPAAEEQHRQLARAGLLRSYLLLCDGTPVAYLRGYQYRDVYYFEEIGFDKNRRDQQPGTVLNFLVIEDLYRVNTPQFLDFGYGENDYKRILGNAETSAVTATLVRAGSREDWLVLLQSLLNSIYGSLRRLAVGLKLETRLRRLLKRR